MPDDSFVSRLLLPRRSVLLGAAALLPLLRARAGALGAPAPGDRFSAIEQRVGGRLGVAVLDTGSGQRFEYRAAERFPLCSTFKLLAVAAVLQRVDSGREQLARRVPYGRADLLDYAPVTKAHVQHGGMTIAALCAAALTYSDNTAANLLLQSLGGPAVVTAFARSLGDQMTRLDRTEPTLNTALSGDDRDTTTPAAMLEDMRAILLGDVLAAASRRRLSDWLIASTTGAARLRAGLPAGWRVGDKTGTGDNGAANDVAIVWPPQRAPLLIAAYLVEGDADAGARNAALADVARLVADSV